MFRRTTAPDGSADPYHTYNSRTGLFGSEVFTARRASSPNKCRGPRSACLWIFQEFRAPSRNIRLRLECVITWNIPLRFFFFFHWARSLQRSSSSHTEAGGASCCIKPILFTPATQRVSAFCFPSRAQGHKGLQKERRGSNLTSDDLRDLPCPSHSLGKIKTRDTLTQRLTVLAVKRIYVSVSVCFVGLVETQHQFKLSILLIT